MNIENKQIILIGPVSVGKSTLGKLVAERLGKQSVSLDDISSHYYKANGFNPTKHRKIAALKGELEAYRYWWPSLAFAARSVLQDYPNCVIDFGAGHSHYENKDLFASVKRAIPLNSYVILLLPFPDMDRSISIVRERSMKNRKTDWVLDGYDFIEHWVKDECNYLLADKILYTNNKTTCQCRDEILVELENES